MRVHPETRGDTTTVRHRIAWVDEPFIVSPRAMERILDETGISTPHVGVRYVLDDVEDEGLVDALIAGRVLGRNNAPDRFEEHVAIAGQRLMTVPASKVPADDRLAIRGNGDIPEAGAARSRYCECLEIDIQTPHEERGLLEVTGVYIATPAVRAFERPVSIPTER